MDRGLAKEEFQRIATAVEVYLSALRKPSDDDFEKLEQLIAALDGLLTAYHASQDVEPSGTQFEYPQRETGAFDRLAAASFPKLGMYACALEPEGDESQGVHFRHAISDLGEVADDMELVLWLADNVSMADALWEFRFGFRTHWGLHLTSVRHYLQTVLSTA